MRRRFLQGRISVFARVGDRVTRRLDRLFLRLGANCPAPKRRAVNTDAKGVPEPRQSGET